ncbi:MAG: hypothetical protein EPO29_05185 [Betaproteobacteria bacterium]|nr:MAG: hypothetical protein EPO29_05185 [Betaproteobacteria bacterium]
MLLAACASPPRPQPEFSFALLGDMPYSHAQANLFDDLIGQLNREPLAFVVHVGDITSGRGPCGDEWLEARARQFARIRHPFVLLPGDNEWTDCHRGGFEPLERLARWRSLFCQPVAALAPVRQPGEYCEHVRWEMNGFVFAGVNVPGSNNNLGRTPRMDAEHAQRMQAVFAWLDEARALARGRKGLVVLMQANPFLEPRAGPDGFAPLREWLRGAAQDASLRLLLVHGDTHRFRDDAPFTGLRRVEVPGSPQLRWLRAAVIGNQLRVEAAEPP